MSGYQKDLKGKLDLNKDPKDYWYINQAETTIVGVDDAEEFQMTDEAFDILNFTQTEKLNVFRICSALVHIGEMQFKQRAREEQADPDGEEGTVTRHYSNFQSVITEATFAANQFGVDVGDLLRGFCKPRVRVGGEWVNKGQNVEQVL